MKTESFKLSKNTIALLEKNGITIATPIQTKIIPAVLAGKDVLAQSETGSGKTISFAIPIIEQIQATDNLVALVLVPTRELCMQVTNEFIKFSQGKRLGVTAVYGGVSIDNQIRKLKKTNIIVATPGRLIDLIDRKTMHLDKIKFLVFDEADRMLDMGFIHDIEKILKQLPHKMQTMLFSATVSKEITVLSKKYLYNPVQVILESSIDPIFLQQTYYQTTPDQKIPLFIHLLKQERDLSLVFCNRKHITEKLANKLSKFGIQAKCLHGDMTQSQRERVTADFRNKRFNILIATDVASRGLHIEDITHVYNFEIPKDVDSYTHRVGRTARAGKKGEAISLVTNGEEQKFFKQILFSYRGSITLKRVDPALLPKVDSFAQDKRNAKGDSRHRDEKPFRRNEKSRTWSEEKPRRFRSDKEKSYGESKPKVWSEDKPRSYRSDRKKSFDDSDKKKSFGDNVPKIWTEEKPRSFRSDRKKSFGDEKKSFGDNKPKAWGDDKPRSFRTGRKKSFGGEKKSFGDDKPKVWGEDKPRSFRTGKKKSFGGEKKSFGDEKPKVWGEDKSRSFRSGKKKSFGGEIKSFGGDKPKVWSKEKPSFPGKRKTDAWDNPISMIWSDNTVDSRGKSQFNPYSENKSKDKSKDNSDFKRKNKPGFFGKKKSGSWEDRKPKFWSEGKSNKRLRKK